MPMHKLLCRSIPWKGSTNPDMENVFSSRYVYSLLTRLAAYVTKVVRANQLRDEHISGLVTDPVML